MKILIKCLMAVCQKNSYKLYTGQKRSAFHVYCWTSRHWQICLKNRYFPHWPKNFLLKKKPQE